MNDREQFIAKVLDDVRSMLVELQLSEPEIVQLMIAANTDWLLHGFKQHCLRVAGRRDQSPANKAVHC